MRVLKERFRLVISGISAGPTKMWSESQIEDDDMDEIPQKTRFRETDFSKPIGEIWNGCIATVKTNESLD